MRPASALLAAIVGLAANAAKLSFDSLVQRDAPQAVQGRSFARFEASFQVAWVVGALLPVVVTLPAQAGFVTLAMACGVALASYLSGRRVARAHPHPHSAVPPTLLASRLHTRVCNLLARTRKWTRKRGQSGRSMRASQRPGASISAGVGSSRADGPQAGETVLAGPLDDAVDERAAPVVLGLAELEAEEALDEAVAVGAPRPAGAAAPR